MSDDKTFSHSDVHITLMNVVSNAGGPVKWAKAVGMSHTPVSLMVAGKRPISEPVANALGFLCETRYRRLR
jgi:hypothetical protein